VARGTLREQPLPGAARAQASCWTPRVAASTRGLEPMPALRPCRSAWAATNAARSLNLLGMSQASPHLTDQAPPRPNTTTWGLTWRRSSIPRRPKSPRISVPSRPTPRLGVRSTTIEMHTSRFPPRLFWSQMALVLPCVTNHWMSPGMLKILPCTDVEYCVNAFGGNEKSSRAARSATSCAADMAACQAPSTTSRGESSGRAARPADSSAN